VRDERASVVDERGGLTRDLHGLRDSADAHLRIHFERASKNDAHVLALDLREASQLEHHLVAPGVQVGRPVLTAGIGHERAGLVRREIGHRHRDAGNGRALFIQRSSLQRAEALLRADEARQAKRERQQEAANA
jgi:hypothetical protein